VTTTQTSSPVVAPNRAATTLLRPAIHAWAMERPFVVAAGLDRGTTVLDVGCGDGAVTRLLAAEVGPRGRVIALDVDEAAIARGRDADADRHGASVTWTCASAYDTGLDDASVDFVLARHLFQHLTDPARALRELHRVLKPGGSVCVLEGHDGLIWIHPEPNGHAAFLSRAAEQQRLRGGDREIGRKLAAYLTETGFADVRSDVHVYDTGRLPPELFVALALEPMVALFPGRGAIEAAASVEACRDALSCGTAHGSAGFYATYARKA
jgi:ubiquinone/menaquinone biosynthesis C-methylase UbiE